MPFRLVRAVVAACLILALPLDLAAQQPKAAKGLTAISAADLQRDLTLHASDAYRGREAGTTDEPRAIGWRGGGSGTLVGADRDGTDRCAPRGRARGLGG